MPDESLLRDQARYAIRSGKLPSRQPDRTWGGPGVGVVCIICDQPVARDQMEFAIGFAGDETMPGVDTYHVHLHQRKAPMEAPHSYPMGSDSSRTYSLEALRARR